MAMARIAALCGTLVVTAAACGSASPGSAAVATASVAAASAELPVQPPRAPIADLHALPVEEAIAAWVSWANDADAPMADRAEALVQLALAGASETVDVAVAALDEPALRAFAAKALAHAGAPPHARTALRAALESSAGAERAAIACALVELGDTTAAEPMMELLDDGTRASLAAVERLDGGRSYDPRKLGALLSDERLLAAAGAPAAAHREVAAAGLAARADARFVAPLAELARNADARVAHRAVAGLAVIDEPSARAALLEILRAASLDRLTSLLDGVAVHAGGAALVIALDAVDETVPQQAWQRRKIAFEKIHALADPRAADALVGWVERGNPHGHWVGEAGDALAEIGDVRGAKYLGARMVLEPDTLYRPEYFWQADAGGHLSRGDRARVVAARHLADLAALHPVAQAEIARAAEAPVMRWIASRPQPHANGLRFLATIQSAALLPRLRGWALPSDPLPALGAQPPFPMAFETAQTALRYLGRMRDEPSYDALVGQLARKPAGEDITSDALMGSGAAMRGMALRALGFGAAHGLAEWGSRSEPSGRAALERLIRDPLWHEEARLAACEAYPWVAGDDALAARAGEIAASDPFLAICWLTALARRPVPAVVEPLLSLLRPELAPELGLAVARALGAAELDASAEARLGQMLTTPELRTSAALALLLGGSAAGARRALLAWSGEDLAPLQDAYERALGFWSEDDFERGRVWRYWRNARALSHLSLRGERQRWAIDRLRAQLDSLAFDQGPRSVTRVFARHRLYRLARSSNARERADAIDLLELLREHGTLLALAADPATASLAERALARSGRASGLE